MSSTSSSSTDSSSSDSTSSSSSDSSPVRPIRRRVPDYSTSDDSSDESTYDSPLPKKSDRSGTIQAKVQKFCYKWTINNYSFCNCAVGQPLDSPKFLTAANSKHQWQLKFYPLGHSRGSQGRTSLYLHLSSSSIIKRPVKVKFWFHIINEKGARTQEFTTDYSFYNSKSAGCRQYVRIEKLTKEVNGLLPNDSLTIFCEMHESTTDLNQTSNTARDSLEFHLSNDIKSFLDNSEFSDVTITASKVKFHAHKIILAARSHVFAVMFSHNTRGNKKENVVNITDVKPEVLKELLRYMYTENVENMDTLGKEIFVASVKYAVEGLKTICEKFLSNRLNIGNVTDTLILAERHNADYLRKQSIFFILVHASKVIDTVGFRSLEKSHPHVVLQIYRELVVPKVKTF